MATIPNLVSAIRIAAVPLFLWLLFGRDDPALAGWVLGAVGATDWVDGYLARKLDQVSEIGKLLDPLADRLAIAAAVIGGWIAGVLPSWFAALLIAREAAVGLGTGFVFLRFRIRLDVRYLGKVATTALYVAVASFYVFAGTEAAFFRATAWAFGLPGLFLYYQVGVQYVIDIRRILARGGAVSSR
ncbi:MAG: CDP-alcohol phosphatidyltransferase family protein [Acidimicrobiia bacterium]